MKTLLVLTAFITTSVFAGTVVSTKKVTLPVNLAEENLKLSRAGYRKPVLKVFIPELAQVTLLDHRNTGAAAPCMSTEDTTNAQDVIQNNPALENVEFTITISKEAHVQENVCKLWMKETINGKIRGFDFSHERFHALPDRKVGDCR